FARGQQGRLQRCSSLCPWGSDLTESPLSRCRWRPSRKKDVIGRARRMAGSPDHRSDLSTMIRAVYKDVGQDILERRRELIAGTVSISGSPLQRVTGHRRHHFLELSDIFASNALAPV